MTGMENKLNYLEKRKKPNMISQICKFTLGDVTCKVLLHQ